MHSCRAGRLPRHRAQADRVGHEADRRRRCRCADRSPPPPCLRGRDHRRWPHPAPGVVPSGAAAQSDSGLRASDRDSVCARPVRSRSPCRAGDAHAPGTRHADNCARGDAIHRRGRCRSCCVHRLASAQACRCRARARPRPPQRHRLHRRGWRWRSRARPRRLQPNRSPPGPCWRSVVMRPRLRHPGWCCGGPHQLGYRHRRPGRRRGSGRADRRASAARVRDASHR